MTIDNNSMKVLKWGAIIAGCIAAALVTRKIVTTIRNKKKDSEDQNTLDKQTKEITSKITPTITAAQARTIANGFYAAMESVGTDEAAIRSLCSSLKNAADWALVVDAFGYKEYGTYGAPLYSFLPSSSTNLAGWLRNECSASLMEEIEAKWRSLNYVI